MNQQSFGVRLGIVISTAALAVVLVLGFKSPDELAAAGGSRPGGGGGPAGGSGGTSTTGGSSGTSSGRTGSGSTGSGSTGSGSTGSGGNAGSAGSGGSSGASGTKTIDGPVEDAFYGPVQVEITVSNGKLVDVEALQLPTGRRSGSISNYAGPVLRQEALAARSANIDGVSGATYTSRAYAASLQAALDQAGL